MADVALRVNEARCLDLADINWELGRFGKVHVRHGRAPRGSGRRERMVPLIKDAGRTLRWFIENVRGLFGDDYARHGAPLLPSERHNAYGTTARAGAETLRAGLAAGRCRPPAGLAGRADPARAAAPSPPSFTWAGWTCWRSSRHWAMPGSRPRWRMSTSMPLISRTPGSPGKSAPRCG